MSSLRMLCASRAGTLLIAAALLAGSLVVDSPLAAQAAVHRTPQAPGGPVVYAINPSTGPTYGGTQVTIFGKGFTSATAVKFGNVVTTCGSLSGSGFIVYSDTEIVGTSPPGALGVVDVVVYAPGGSSATGAADKFTYTNPAVAVVNGLSPNAGPTSGGTNVTINGTGFSNATHVLFGANGVPVRAFSDTILQVTSPPGAAGTVDVIVQNPVGNSAATAATKFTYVAPGAPVVNAVFPNSSPAAGRQSEYIFGNGFTRASVVKFGTTTLSPGQFYVDDDSHIFVISVPPGTAATTVDVTVTTPNGTSAATNADKFSYLAGAAPVVNAMLVNQGATSGGTQLSLYGSGFSGVTAVHVGGNLATGVSSPDDTQLFATTPAGAAGTVDVTVTTPLGTSPVSGADRFTYLTALVPVIYGISPHKGTPAGGNYVYIYGSGFSGATSVHFGANTATNLSVSDTSIFVTSPSGTAGTVDVTVTTPGGTSLTGPADKYTYAAPGVPVVSSVFPNSGPPGGGTYIYLFGSGFTGASAVHFGGTLGTFLYVYQDTQMSVVPPAGTNGATVDITVTTPAGTSAVTAADKFTYVTPSLPVVTAVSPSSGPSTGGTTVWISGSALTGGSVKFGANFANFEPVSDNLIKVLGSPAGTSGATVDVTVTTGGGTSATSAADHFTYTTPPQPAVSGVSPSSGTASGGSTVYVSGSGFSGATALNFGLISASFFPNSDGTLITATSPAGTASTTVDVTVVGPGGTSTITANDHFSYTATTLPPPPAVSAVSPSSGSVSGGYALYISGSNFTGASQVAFGAVTTSYTVTSDNLITLFSAPSGPLLGTVDVTVTTPSGTSTISANDHFTYVAAAAPVVTAVSPGTGPAGGGTLVYITGNNLEGASAVSFGGVAASYALNPVHVIIATSPAGSGTVDVTVTTPGGTSATSANDQFVYGGPPPSGLQVNAVAPNSGPPAGGTNVTIHGLGFTGATAVMFGSTPTQNFFVFGDTQISVFNSPAGSAGTVDVRVVNGSTSAVSNADKFTYLAPVQPVVNAIDPNHGSSAGGTSLTIFGSGLSSAKTVTFGSFGSVTVFPFSDTSLSVSSPPGTAGTSVDVTVTNAVGTSATSNADMFTFVTPAVPVVNALEPATGTTTGGTLVTIVGSGLRGATEVLFGSTPASSISAFTDTQITVTSPSGAVGSVDVTVIAPGGTSATSNADKFTYVAPGIPVISAITPNRGGTAGGRTVRIFGSGFAGASSVRFGATSATQISNSFFGGDSELDVVSPPGAAGTVHITVTAPGGVSVNGAADLYTYFVAGPPSISAVSPSSGTAGTLVFITGAGLSDVTAVYFGSTCVPVYNGSFNGSDTFLETSAPAGPTGTVDVTVVSPDGTSAITANDQFTYTAAATPTVTAVAPASGSSAGGTVVYITGTGLSAVTSVTFGANPAVPSTGPGTTSALASGNFYAYDDGLIYAVSPAGAIGTVDVKVTSAGGTSATGAFDQFTYVTTPGPAVTAVSPNTGPDGGGSQTFVTGSGFLSATSMHFGSTVLTPCFFFRGGRSPIANAPKPALVSASRLPSVQVPIATRVPIHDPKSLAPGSNSAPRFATVLVPSVPHQLLTAPRPAAGNVTAAPQFLPPPPCPASFAVMSDNLIDVNTPSRGTNPATVDLTVTSPSGTSATGAADQYTFGPTPAPVVSAVSPSSGPSGGGITVFISGSHLAKPTAVHFGTAAATILPDQFYYFFFQGTDSLVEAISPPGTNPSTVDVTVTTAGGTSATSAADHFTYGPTPTPTVSAVSPNTGPAGTTTFITGTGFIGATAVNFGTTPAIPAKPASVLGLAPQAPHTGFFVMSDNLIQAISPAHALGVVDVSVVSAGGTSATSAADHYTYTASATPAVTAIGPSTGVGGTVVYVTGTGFTGASTVSFGGAAAGFIIISDSLIQAFSPAGPAGPVDVTVTTPGGTSASSAADVFTYGVPPPAPTVSSVVPSTGPSTGGTSVTITGTNLTGATSVKFGTVAATAFTVITTTKITATSPAGSGVVDVIVTTAGGPSVVNAGDKFTYTGIPTVTSLAPFSGPSAGGTSVVITGTNLTGATAVMFGTVAATFTVNSSTQITATSPAGSGTVDVTVTTPSGTSATSGADQFTYVAAPTVSSVVPNSGPAAGGTPVTITGTNFVAPLVVKFGAVLATGVTIISPTQVTATSPAGSGVVHVTVSTAGGTSGTSAADQFTYIAAPTVSSLVPTGGPAAGGTSVTITGTNLTGATAVKFGTVAATSFLVNSATQITTTSPAGSGAVDVTVTTPGGTSAASAADKFTYSGPPTVSSVAPSSGPAAGGTSVVITGTNLTGATAVMFGSVAATNVVVNSATQITATSPAGAGTVDVTVTTPGGTSATNVADKFTYLAAPTVSSVVPNTGPTSGGTSVVITGTNLTGATAVKFGTAAATNVVVNSATQISATSPAGAVGTVDVTVTTAGGTSAINAGDQFTYAASACSNATLTSNKVSPQPGGTTVTFTGTATGFGCTSPLYQFWTWSVATGWVSRQAYSATNTWSLDTTGMAPGTFTVDVWAEQAGSSVGLSNYETFGLEAWVVGGCDFASLTPNPGQTTGTVHFVASAGGAGCGTPLYQFYVYTATTGFVSQGPFSPTNFLDVNTALLTSASYTIDVWVKQQGSPLTYETWALSSIGNGGPCGGTTSTTITPAQATPQSTGVTVDFTTVTTGCTSPQYRYWLYPGTGGTWQMLQDYGVGSGVYHWNTTGLKPGTYSIVVHVRKATSTSTYDTYGALSYSVTGASSATLSGSPVSPQAVGTPVTLTAAAPGSAPQYQFWVYMPATGWTMVQDFSSTATYHWTTTGLAKRTYAWVVYVKQQGSPNLFDSYALLSFSIT